MEKKTKDGGGLICIGINRMQFIMGGTTVACSQSIWDYIKKALNFIKEYQSEIIKGFKRGWNKF